MDPPSKPQINTWARISNRSNEGNNTTKRHACSQRLPGVTGEAERTVDRTDVRACEVIAEAHGFRIVHRNSIPENRYRILATQWNTVHQGVGRRDFESHELVDFGPSNENNENDDNR